MPERHRFTKEQLDYIRQGYREKTREELVPAFNDRFMTSLSNNQIAAAIKNHKIKSGRSGRFVKGQKSWNEGKAGYMGSNATSFKKGNRPHNHKPLWSERVGKDGYIEMSVPERNPYTGFPTRFKHKHLWIWEQANGLKPKGTAVIFKDGDNRNLAIDNLLLVTRAELLTMNLHGYKDQPDELKPSVLALAKVEAKAGIRTRPGRGRKSELQEAHQ